MNALVFNPEVQAFIQENLYTDITKLILKKAIFDGISNTELAEQIQGKVVCEKKLPTWFSTPDIYFPKKLAIEQSSSEKTATYKSSLIKGDSLLDLTGGFGVDSFYFSKTSKQVTYLEQQVELSRIAEHNANVLGAKNIEFIANDGIAYINESNRMWDVLYIDPSRRIASQKVVRLTDCEPNVIDLYLKLAATCNHIWIKAAPLLDIKLALTELKNVQSVHVVSVGNELKELLVKQIESSVRWRESVLLMIEKGVTEFIEIGPGKVLSGLIKRIDRNVKVSAINSEEDIKLININE